MRLFSHLRQKQVETANHAVARQDGFFARYIEWLDAQHEPGPAARKVTILARSPMSSVVLALRGRVDDLKARGVIAKVLLARVEPEDALRDTVDTLTALGQAQPLDTLLRWADKRCLLEAHEQLTLGPAMCWSGDMMRRDPSRRDGLDLFEVDAPQTVRLGALAFDAIWALAIPVPASRLRERVARPSGSFERDLGEAMPKPAFLKPAEDLPFVRH
jgi:hypothetical protein